MGVSFGTSAHPFSSSPESPTPICVVRSESPKPFSPRTMAAAVAGDKPPRLSATKARARKQITNERENTEALKDRENHADASGVDLNANHVSLAALGRFLTAFRNAHAGHDEPLDEADLVDSLAVVARDQGLVLLRTDFTPFPAPQAVLYKLYSTFFRCFAVENKTDFQFEPRRLPRRPLPNIRLGRPQ